MTVEKLRKLLASLDGELKIFVACEGYTNRDPDTGDYYENDETQLEEVGGVLYIKDTCGGIDE